MNRQQTTKSMALYERLSHDDEQQGPSNSILHQRQLLEEYAQTQSLPGILHFTDDGWSGTRWDRPDFNRMMDEIEAGNIGTLLVKDAYVKLKLKNREIFLKAQRPSRRKGAAFSF